MFSACLLLSLFIAAPRLLGQDQSKAPAASASGGSSNSSQSSSSSSDAGFSSSAASGQEVPDRARFSPEIAASTLVHKVKPTYPAAARAAHIEGTVVLHAIIAKDGTVEHLDYVSGPAELKDSAIQAVGKWRYKPMLLNDRPVEVDTEISVKFGKQ
jgi:protein TonB